MLPQPLRIGLISEHASPLATIGSVDTGGQNIYVSHLARGLADDMAEVYEAVRRTQRTLLQSGRRLALVSDRDAALAQSAGG